MESKPKIYVIHEGTIKVSGGTLPKTAAGCAYHYLQRGIQTIEFFYIGANAGHQAVKAMTIFSHIIRRELNDIGEVAFVPTRVIALTDDGTGKKTEKDATVWKTVLIKK
jgi:stage V sporulation protein SpoVS